MESGIRLGEAHPQQLTISPLRSGMAEAMTMIIPGVKPHPMITSGCIFHPWNQQQKKWEACAPKKNSQHRYPQADIHGP
jgi:hypothetical protein